MRRILFIQNLIVLLVGAVCHGVAQPFPSVAEFDLVFPRNDTYAPPALMPMVWALRNTPAWIPMMPQIQWNLHSLPNHAEVDVGFINLNWGINSSVDPWLVGAESYHLQASEGSFYPIWELTYTNCTVKPPASNGLNDNLGVNTNSSITYFTLKNSFQTTNQAIAAPTSCPSENGYAINVTSTQKVNSSSSGGQPECPVLASVLPLPSPCALQLSSSAISSVLSALTSQACIPTQHAGYVGPCPTATLNGAGHMAGTPEWDKALLAVMGFMVMMPLLLIV